MSISLKAALGIAGVAFATTAGAQVTLYSHENFRGEQFTANGPVRNLERAGFNDRASSIVVDGGDWQVCDDARFNGRCVVLRPGEYPTLDRIGLNNEISSVRPVEGRYGYNEDRDRYAYRDRGEQDRGEQLYEAPVTSVHAVVGPPDQRCWVERREFTGDVNVPGAIAGAVIGGVLGNQIGHGHGRDLATAGGAIAGAAVGGSVGSDQAYGGDIEHCRTVGNYDHPDYWDVTYSFHGVQHRIQMSSPPGDAITVNADGDPAM
jgi:uncharacterized protein YcfJ